MKKIISGGQTGADREGTDAAIALRIDYGGSIPRGRRTEDGVLPERYSKIVELKTTSYPARTEKNVTDSDCTVMFTYNNVGAGSALTPKLAGKHNKPCLHINLKECRIIRPCRKPLAAR
jgi:Circularly permutated YpsA SLOG family